MGPVANAPLNVRAGAAQLAPPVPPDRPRTAGLLCAGRPRPHHRSQARPAAAGVPAAPIAMPSPEPAPPARRRNPGDMMAAIQQRRSQREAAGRGNGAWTCVAARRGRDAPSANADAVGREGVGVSSRCCARVFEPGSSPSTASDASAGRTMARGDRGRCGRGRDVELAIVRRMIELIRTHYSGDFQWESNRLGRIVVLPRGGRRPGLEEFLQKEFFACPPSTHGVLVARPL